MITPLAWPDVVDIAKRMCEGHRRSACALADTDDPVAAIEAFKHSRHVGGTIWHGARPAVAIGAVLIHPGVASSFLYATDDLPKVAVELVRFARNALMPSLQRAGIHRVHALAPTDEPTNDKFHRLFGGKKEAVLRRYGKNGEDFTLYAYLWPRGLVT